MTAQPFQELLPAQRRRVIFRVVLRGVLSAAVLAVLYYLLPLDEPWNGDTAVRLDVLRDGTSVRGELHPFEVTRVLCTARDSRHSAVTRGSGRKRRLPRSRQEVALV